MRGTSALALCTTVTLLLTGCAKDAPSNDAIGPAPTSTAVRTLMDVTTGLEVTSGQVGTFNHAGQSFVVFESGSFQDLRFNFYSFRKEPVAFGNLYLLTQEYLGLPGGLSSSTPGFVARSEGTASGVYTFATTVAIMAVRSTGSTPTPRDRSRAASTPTSSPPATCT